MLDVDSLYGKWKLPLQLLQQEQKAYGIRASGYTNEYGVPFPD